MSSELEQGSVGFRLTDPEAVLIEPIGASGKAGDIFVIDQEFNNPQNTSMFVRVIGKASPMPHVTLGGVYVVPVYCWEEMPFAGETWLLTSSRNLLAEMEGYDNVSGS